MGFNDSLLESCGTDLEIAALLNQRFDLQIEATPCVRVTEKEKKLEQSLKSGMGSIRFIRMCGDE